ncbi:MAG: hypothetical protein RIC29_00560 [Rhodospirillaceae bacterium]
MENSSDAYIRDRLETITEAYFSLASEVWVVLDRLYCMEEALKISGIDISKDIETLTPDGEYKEKLDQKRTEFVSGVFKALERN